MCKDLGAMAYQGRVVIARVDALPRGGGKIPRRSA